MGKAFLAPSLLLAVLVGLAEVVGSHGANWSGQIQITGSLGGGSKPKVCGSTKIKECVPKPVHDACCHAVPQCKPQIEALTMVDVNVMITIVANFYTYSSVPAMMSDCQAKSPNGYAILVQVLTMCGLMKGGVNQLSANVKFMMSMIKMKIIANMQALAKLKNILSLLMQLMIKMMNNPSLSSMVKCLMPAAKSALLSFSS